MSAKLNIGAGECHLPGYLNIDRKTGHEAYPLAFEPESFSEIRASHILEHFPHGHIGAVLADWVAKLAPGGVLKIAVPDFAWVAQAYLSGADLPIQGYVMGGQCDSDDIHHSIFDEECLREALAAAGLIGISRWFDNAPDCSSLECSLNLLGVKPGGVTLGRVMAVMSVPRLGFMDNMFCSVGILPKFGIELSKTTGAFWGQCLTRGMEEAITAGADWLLAIDYDTVYTASQLELLLSVAARHPEADAIAPLQSHRSEPTPLMTIKGADGLPVTHLPAETFAPELTRVSTAHFGLTLIRVSSLHKLPRPWFVGHPDAEGRWGDGRIDDDIHFWRAWEAAGLSLYQANRVPVGHLELKVRWPGHDFNAIHQHPGDFYKNGPPEHVWR